MGKPKGSQKTGGRKKGTKNKNSIFLREILDELDFNTGEELISLYKTSPPGLKAQILLKIIDFTYTKPGSADLSLESTDAKDFNIQLNYKI